MHRLLVIVAVFVSTNAGLVRVPKIYNALISSDENLSPSHAIPVLEPVLRTTALGVAFPPLIVHPPTPELIPQNFQDIKQDKELIENTDGGKEASNSGEEVKKTNGEEQILERKEVPPQQPQFAYHGSLYPVAIDPYLTYTYTPELLYPSLPYYHQPIFVDLGHAGATDNKKKPQELPHPPLNFKKNPDIPDVPPPPLPVKNSSATTTKTPN